MRTRDLFVGLGVFAVVLVGIVGVAAAAGPLLETDGSPTTTSTEVPSAFEAGSISVDSSEAAGEVAVQAASSGDVVVIDTAHGNDQSTEKVQTLERVLVENGYEVRYHGSGSNSAAAGRTGSIGGAPGSESGQSKMNESLRDADAYVIINPSSQYDRSEAASVRAFADAGGRVLIMSDPGSLSIAGLLAQALGANTGSSADALTPVSSQFGVGVGSGYLYNMAEYDSNYQTIYASGTNSSLSEGVDRVSVDRAAPVFASPDATVALTTSADTELSDSGMARKYAVAARNQDVSIVGDTSILDPARLQHADNEVFVGNLIEFLVGGTVQPDAFASSEPDSQPPEQHPSAASSTDTTAGP
jgi:hypothetical protein